MFEYTRLDASVLLSVAVLITFALLTTSIIVRMLGSVSPFRLWIGKPVVAGTPPGGRQDTRPDGTSPPAIRPHGPTDIDLARLDDDGGGSRRAPAADIKNSGVRGRSLPFGPVERFHTPMIPGARESGVLTTFGVPPAVFLDSPTTMDAATIAARQREGGGAPSERRPLGERSPWHRFWQTLRSLLKRA